jgi:hypothetical protein
MTPQELRDWARARYDVALIPGLAQPVQTANASFCEGRVASFYEFNRFRAWYLRLDAPGPLVWRTAPLPDPIGGQDVVFAFPMGLGNGAILSQPSGQFDLYVNGQYAVAFRVAKHSQTWRGPGATLHFAARRFVAAPPDQGLTLDRYLQEEAFATFGLGLLQVPARFLAPGEPVTIKVVPRSDVPSTRWFQLCGAQLELARVNPFPGLAALCEPSHPQSSGYNVYFGDIHTHSGESRSDYGGCGLGSWEENYRYAQGPGGLEIYALTDHERQIMPHGMAEYFSLVEKYYREGEFVTLAGFEHTNTLYGHRNVYFGSANGVVVSANRDWVPDYWNTETAIPPTELWAALDDHGEPAITVPHHPAATSHPLTWDFHDPRYDRLAEVYSGWGSSEYYGDYPRGVADRYPSLYVREALNRGYRLGLIASGDGHDGHPGNAQSPLVKHHHIFHPLGSGWVAVLADALTRESVFDALYARRCYGTTGVPIGLGFTVNGEIMGSELPALDKGAAPLLHVRCHGANALDHVRIIKNGVVVATIPCHGEWTWEIDWRDEAYDPAIPSYYYIRVVQADRESAWSSPVWVG